MRDYTICIAKTKVTAKLVWAFVFAYANCWFSHATTLFSHMQIVGFLMRRLLCLLFSISFSIDFILDVPVNNFLFMLEGSHN